MLLPIRVQRSGIADLSIQHSFQPASTALYGPSQIALGNMGRSWCAVDTHASLFPAHTGAESSYIFSASLPGLLSEKNKIDLSSFTYLRLPPSFGQYNTVLFFLNKAVLDIYSTAPSTKSSPGRSSDLRARL